MCGIESQTSQGWMSSSSVQRNSKHKPQVFIITSNKHTITLSNGYKSF